MSSCFRYEAMASHVVRRYPHGHRGGWRDTARGGELGRLALSRLPRDRSGRPVPHSRFDLRATVAGQSQAADSPRLRQALYHLTKRLGSGLIVRRGRQRVGVDRERMVCDVHRFEAALREGKSQDALVDYRGDFLEGFVLTSQPEPFEEWIRSTRLRLLD